MALDRPGYGALGSLPGCDASGQNNASRWLTERSTRSSDPTPRGAGLFLLAHSAGCELAVRMAADERAEHAGLIGLELAGTGLQYADADDGNPEVRDRDATPDRAA